ncbi:MAG TPA: hypothetical protein VE986_01155 [Hyphomicrobiales bacterium]|nr:hypothetical protein [Hyphomicrobiales bacterium]
MAIFRRFHKHDAAVKTKQEEWLAAEFISAGMENYDDWARSRPGSTTEWYIKDWIERCKHQPTTVRITQNGLAESLIRNLPNADRFGVVTDINAVPIRAEGKLIDLLRVAGNGDISLKDCAIRELHLRTAHRNVRLINCRVRKLILDEGATTTLEIAGGSIESILAPPPSDKAPFTGSVEIRDVRFSTAFENAQAYRNLRHHLSALHNHEAASVFHAAEMQAEVQRQSLIDKTISFFYHVISNYGASSARPFIIFAFLLGVNFAFLFSTDGVALLEETREADGWHYDLYGAGLNARALRAAVFALSQVLNPLGIFGTRLLLSGKTPAVAFVSGILGLLSAIALALFVLAIRRRFRLDRSS